MDSSENENLINYFFICGLDEEIGLDLYDIVYEEDLQKDARISILLPPLERCFKCNCLQHFPQESSLYSFDMEAITTMVMPHGLQLTSSSYITDETAFNRKDLENHSFLLTREDGSQLHGRSLLFWEHVTQQKVLQAVADLYQMYRIEKVSAGQDPETIEMFDPTEHKLYARKAIGVLTRYPYLTCLETWLYDLFIFLTCEERPIDHLSVESYIYNLLYEVPLPPEGQLLAFKGVYRKHFCRQPVKSAEFPLFELPLRGALEVLGMENLIKLFTCALLEHRIVLMSQDYRLLMLVGESLVTLLYPFNWSHVYTPILPTRLRRYLEAPLPFIMGLRCGSKEEVQLPSDANVCYMHIDSKDIFVSEDVPAFPNVEALRQEVTELLASSTNYQPFGHSPASSIDRRSSVANHSRARRSSKQGLGEAFRRSRENLTDGSLYRAKAHSTPKMTTKSESTRTSSLTVVPPAMSDHSPIITKRRNSRPLNEIDLTLTARVIDIDLDGPEPSSTNLAVLQLVHEGLISINELSFSLDHFNYSYLNQSEQDLDKLYQEVNDIDLNHYIDLLKFNNALREIFLNHFVHLFLEFETFFPSLPPSSTTNKSPNKSPNKSGGLSSVVDQMMLKQKVSDEYTGESGFDKSTFLNEHSWSHRAFLSAFLESQMLTCFFDMKMISAWSGDKSQASLNLFESRQQKMIQRKKHKTSQGSINIDSGVGSYTPWTMDENVQFETVLLQSCQWTNIFSASEPHSLSSSQSMLSTNRLAFTFPIIDKSVLSEPPKNKAPNTLSIPRSVAFKKFDNPNKDGRLVDKMAKIWMARTRVSSCHPNMSNKGSIAEQQTNHQFVATLLAECNTKTKRMVLQKIFNEEGLHAYIDQSVSGVEENTLVSSFCDMLERIWCHGLNSKKNKSALWTHLTNFAEKESVVNQQSKLNLSNTPSSSEINLALESLDIDYKKRPIYRCEHGNRLSSSYPNLSVALSDNRRSSIKMMPQETEINFSQNSSLSILDDIRIVQNMKFVKTEIGLAKAFIRLALEKKKLYMHLRTVLSDVELLGNLYKTFAFLRCQDEREKFLCYLLALNAVDYFTFTTAFKEVPITYKVRIYSGQNYKSSRTTANVWMCLSGQHGETNIISVPPDSHSCFEIQNENLGILFMLRIGHDNAGPSPKWYVEFVLVQNSITGHIYKFPCGRWFGRSIDDGSMERLLIGEPLKSILHDNRVSSDENSNLWNEEGYFTMANQRVKPRTTDKNNLDYIYEHLGSSMNLLVKHLYKGGSERSRLTVLLCGPDGVLSSLFLVFQYKFKSTRFLQKDIYLWDYLMKVFNNLKNKSDIHNDSNNLNNALIQMYKTINAISMSETAVGKDGKFQKWLCFGLRERLLCEWIEILAKQSITAQLYEAESFIRCNQHRETIIKILDTLGDFSFQLEPIVFTNIICDNGENF